MAEGAQTLRSRLYRLQMVNGQQTWVQKGQGYPEFKREDSLFRLRYFAMAGRQTLYDVTVDTNIQFQKGQNGIQWTQIKESEVMAISFKEQFSANAFWQLIEQYQRKYAISVPAADGIYFYFEYKVPDPTPNNLPQVLVELENIPQAERHERVASIFLTKRDLLPRLLSTFRKLEETIEVEKLETLFQIIKIVFNASNQQLFYELMCNQAFMGVLGILEYDPNFRSQRSKHREFMMGKSKLLQVVPFRNTPDLLNLVVFTYRLEYIRQCILFPYLNDNGFGSSGCIIRNNYKKIFNHIFSNKRKDFINSLYDLLRLQDLPAFRFLRELFRIARIHYMPEIYQQIADKDTFEIFIRNLRQYLVPNPPEVTTKKKKRKPQQLQQIVQACLEILQQFMEHQPHHLRNFVLSEGEKVAKYPVCQFLLEQFQSGPPIITDKLGIILKALFGPQPSQLKDLFKGKILQRFLSQQTPKHVVKWMPIFSQVLIPRNDLITQCLPRLLPLLVGSLRVGNKGQQIFHISVLKTIFQTYIVDSSQVQSLLTCADEFVDYLWINRGGEGIRLSAFLTLFLPQRFGVLLTEMIRILRVKSQGNGLMAKYIDILVGLTKRKDIVLPSSLKRAEQCLDEENFDKLSKKIKID